MTSVITNRKIKPVGGLWASPLDSNLSWRNFCIDNHWNEGNLQYYFDFVLDQKSHIFIVNSSKDAFEISQMFPGIPIEKKLDLSILTLKATIIYK